MHASLYIYIYMTWLKFRLKRDNSVLTFCPGISLYHFALSVLPFPFSIRSLALTALPFLLFPLSLSFSLSLSPFSIALFRTVRLSFAKS